MLEQHALDEIEGFTFLRRGTDYYDAVSELKTHVEQRATAVYNYLGE